MEMENTVNNGEKNSKNRKRSSFSKYFGCITQNDDVAVVQKKEGGGTSFNSEAACADHVPKQTHLIVMANGIIGSAKNWRYAAKHFVKAYPDDVIVHCSESNTAFLTFDGIDVMGKRLAEEVISVVERHSTLQKISFVGHSLGGLVARYAIALLYQQDLVKEPAVEVNGACDGEESNKSPADKIIRGKIAGLEPINFITSATPHLGCRGHKQVPMFCGFQTLEKAAARASSILGRTGKHLFLCDADNGKPPLLLQMSSDTDDLKFISSLESFKKRVAYANARFDHIVGWSSSSLRRINELPKRRHLLRNGKYRHIFSEQTSKSANPQAVSLQNKVPSGKSAEMEEAMIKGLTRVTWERVDVNFTGSIQQIFAHNTIQVKTYYLNYHGVHVVKHMIDNFQL